MSIMTEAEYAELKRLRLEAKALREQNAYLRARLEVARTPMLVQELIESLACDDDMPVYLYDLSTQEAYPLLQVDPTVSDRIDLNFRSEPEEL